MQSLLVLPSGDVLVGGSFNTAGGVSASNIALYKPLTNTWLALGAGLTSEASLIFGLALAPGGDVFVAGQFNHAGGLPANNLARYTLGIPNCCRADFNADGVLDPDDLADFIALYFAAPPPPAADFNRDGTADPDDLSDFIAAYFAGCP